MKNLYLIGGAMGVGKTEESSGLVGRTLADHEFVLIPNQGCYYFGHLSHHQFKLFRNSDTEDIRSTAIQDNFSTKAWYVKS